MNNKQMKPARVKQLEEIAARIERLCDNRDLLLEAMRDEFDAAEKEGFDRDGLCLVIRRRVGDLTGDAFHNQNAMKYLHALGDVDSADACGMVKEKSAA